MPLRPGRLGLMVDFDGTISDIALSPDEAVISPRSAASLRRLAGAIDLVSVVSGRAVQDLSDRVGLDGVMCVGNHGVEYLGNGEMCVAPGAAEYRDKIRGLVDHLKGAAIGDDLFWSDKGYSASVHYRMAQDPERARRGLDDALDSAPYRDELEVFWGKMVMEIRAPGGFDKGYAFRRLVRKFRLDSAIVLGDDITDVDAVAALRELREQGGVLGLGVAVLHDDSPIELVRSADYGLRGVSEVDVFLKRLADLA